MNYRDDHYKTKSLAAAMKEDERLAAYQATHPTLHARAQIERARALLGKKAPKRRTLAGTAFKGSAWVIRAAKALVFIACAVATYQSVKDLIP